MASTFSARVAADLIAFASERGGDEAALRTLLGLPQDQLGREDVRIPCATMARMWEAAHQQTQDPCLALHLAEARTPAANRTTTLIMESSRNVLEAFELAAKYSVLIADAMSVEIGEIDETIYVQFTPQADWALQPLPVVQDCLNITYLSAVQAVQRLTGSRQPPSLLSFAMPKPENLAEYFRIFNCSIRFDATANRIGFPKVLRDSPVVTGDAGLKEVLKQYAEELKSRFQAGGGLVDEVLRAIYDGMSPHPPTLSVVARSLGISDRSLQRRLKLEGETYKQLVERARMTLSQTYLLNSNRNLDEIAYLSGYADTSSFVRAFRRWHGQSPRQFARQQAAGQRDAKAPSATDPQSLC